MSTIFPKILTDIIVVFFTTSTHNNIQPNDKHTIEDNLRRASRQSNRVVISLLRAKITERQALSKIQHYLKHKHSNAQKVILITKDEKIIDFPA